MVEPMTTSELLDTEAIRHDILCNHPDWVLHTDQRSLREYTNKLGLTVLALTDEVDRLRAELADRPRVTPERFATHPIMCRANGCDVMADVGFWTCRRHQRHQ